MLTTALVVAIAIVLAFAGLGWWSHTGGKRSPDLAAGRLARCPPAPNCVCSEHADDVAHHVPPLALPRGDAAAQWAAVERAVRAAGGRIESTRGDYLHATFTSRVFRFVDDVELRRDGDRLQVRSASRVGHSDLGVNRRRVETLRRLLVNA